MQRYYLEFILHIQAGTAKALKSSLAEFAEDICICEHPEENKNSKDFKVTTHTEDPTLVFDICSQFGRIRSVKVDERKP